MSEVTVFRRFSLLSLYAVLVVIFSLSTHATLAQQQYDVRLFNPHLENTSRDGNAQMNAGRIEIYYNGQWGSVCSSYVRKFAADVICRMVGFGQAVTTVHDGRYDPVDGDDPLPVLLEGVWCRTGTEGSLASCTLYTEVSADCANHTVLVSYIGYMHGVYGRDTR